MSVTVKIEDRAYDFALRIVRMVQALPENYASQAIGRQVLRQAQASVLMLKKPSVRPANGTLPTR
jgi:hypothetical protein